MIWRVESGSRNSSLAMTWIAVGVTLYGMVGNSVDGLASQQGDTDGDCDVDIGDVNAWVNNFGAMGEPAVPLLGDSNGDGKVDLDDRGDWANNFGAGEPIVGPPADSNAMIEIRPFVSDVVLSDQEFVDAWWTSDRGGAVIRPGQGTAWAFVEFYLSMDGVGRPEAEGWANFGGGFRSA